MPTLATSTTYSLVSVFPHWAQWGLRIGDRRTMANPCIVAGIGPLLHAPSWLFCHRFILLGPPVTVFQHFSTLLPFFFSSSWSWVMGSLGPFGFFAQAAVLQRFDIRCRSACGSCGMFCNRNSPSFLSPCSHIFAQWVAAFQAFRRGIHRHEALEDVAHTGIPVHSYAADREKQIAIQNTQKQYGHQRKPRYKNTSC